MIYFLLTNLKPKQGIMEKIDWKKRAESLAKDNIKIITDNVSLKIKNKELIEKYELENKNILKRRPDLSMYGDFTPEGIKLFCNTGFISDIKSLNIPVIDNQNLNSE